MTVNFTCSHCKNLMAVGLNLLGRNVRCPTCKQVVQAPAAPPPPAPERAPSSKEIDLFPDKVKTDDEPDSIFGEQHDEDLFGTKSPKIVIPEPVIAADFGAGNLPVPQMNRDLSSPQPTSPKPSATSTEPPTIVETAANGVDEGWMNGAGATGPAYQRTSPVVSRASRSNAAGAKSSSSGGNTAAFTWILLLYAVSVTAGAGYLLYDKISTEKRPESVPPANAQSLKAIPDIYGQYEKADRKKIVWVEGMPPPDVEVPADLRVRLGQPITVGQLEITPKKIEHKTVMRFNQEKGKAPVQWRETPVPVYLLHLTLRNVSNDVSFHPNDPAFNRQHATAPGSIAPYNALIVDGAQFPGGPFEWPLTDANIERKFIQGQGNDNELLLPHQSRDTVICSDFHPGLKLEPAMRTHRADPEKSEKPLLWRVQLRTGLQAIENGKGQESEIPITSIIGVEFLAQDIN